CHYFSLHLRSLAYSAFSLLIHPSYVFFFFFFFNDTATTEIYTLSLHDALPISFSVSINRRRSECENLRHAYRLCVSLPLDGATAALILMKIRPPGLGWHL